RDRRDPGPRALPDRVRPLHVEGPLRGRSDDLRSDRRAPAWRGDLLRLQGHSSPRPVPGPGPGRGARTSGPPLRQAADAAPWRRGHGARLRGPLQRPKRRRRPRRCPRRRRPALLLRFPTRMPGLEDLYREIILDHSRNPRNRGELSTPPALRVEGFNPLCGDEIIVYLIVTDGVVSDLRIGGQGCSISQSSASMMSAAVKGKTVSE